MSKKLKTIKIVLGAVILIGIVYFAGQYNQKGNDVYKMENTKVQKENTEVQKNTINQKNNEVSETEKINYATSNKELCVEGAFTAPSQQEIDYNNTIKKDKFVQYLREILDKVSNDVSVDDDYFISEDGLKYKKYMKSKFIVLSTNVAPGGGESIVIIFKDQPGNVFYVWVYGDSEGHYNLRKIKNLTESESGKKKLKKTQETVINQLCSEDFGI